MYMLLMCHAALNGEGMAVLGKTTIHLCIRSLQLAKKIWRIGFKHFRQQLSWDLIINSSGTITLL